MYHYHQNTPEQIQWLTAIIRSGEHLLTLINDVLDFATIEAGRVTLEFQKIELSRLLDEIHEMFLLPTQDKNLQWKIDCDSSVPPLLYTDEVKLRQVLINLLSNAIKFTKQGTICLQVSSVYEDTKNAEKTSPIAVRFAVEDTGEGIAPDEISHLFEAFTQTQAGRRSSIKGTGLGLAISQNFVQLLGGKIEVESCLHQGSCFHFTLPLKDNGEQEVGTRS